MALRDGFGWQLLAATSVSVTAIQKDELWFNTRESPVVHNRNDLTSRWFGEQHFYGTPRVN